MSVISCNSESVQVHQGEVSSDKLQRGGLVTAVANHKEMLLGQKLRLEGHWIKHKKYGSQLEVSPSLNLVPKIYSQFSLVTSRSEQRN